MCVRVSAWARMRMRTLVRAGVRACVCGRVCVRACMFLYACMIYQFNISVNPTPGECYNMVTPCQVLNVHIAKEVYYNTMQVYILNFVTDEGLNRMQHLESVTF